MKLRSAVAAVFTLVSLSACAALSGVGVQAPQFGIASGESSSLRLLGPSLERPVGGAMLRLYARVENPNPIGITLSRVAGTVRLEGFDAAEADFPLGLPLTAGGSAVVPLDIAVNFANLPGLADVLGRAISGGSIGYSLRGTVAVDAGLLGQPTFGPMSLLSGSVQIQR